MSGGARRGERCVEKNKQRGRGDVMSAFFAMRSDIYCDSAIISLSAYV